jgi:hypothetical protein
MYDPEKIAGPALEWPRGHMMKGCGQHIIFLLFALPGAAALYTVLTPGTDMELRWWFTASIAVPVLHQWLVWLFWRLQLRYLFLTRIFGSYDLAVWGLLFLPLLMLRIVTLMRSGSLDRGSIGSCAGLLGLHVPLEVYELFRWTAVIICLLPALYGIWSVIRYFGLVRALGADHFRSRYRSMELETRGAYAYSGNVMYGMIFLLLWALAFILDSPLVLVSAAFQHSYIWVHYHGTEEPDMKLIYGTAGNS